MKNFPWKKVHFIGIGGVGMSGLAHILNEAGVSVSGSDLEETPTIIKLVEAGVHFSIGHMADYVEEDCDLIVFSSAVPETNPERQKANLLGIEEMRRGVFLAHISTYFDKVVAVGGSHGKTTITCMLAWVFHALEIKASWLIGGMPSGSLRPANYSNGGAYFLTEVDESDGTLAYIEADIGVVPNAEEDHSWSAGGESGLQENFQLFGGNCQQMICGRTDDTKELFGKHAAVTFFDPSSDFIHVPQPGGHNRFNARLALAVCEELGLETMAVTEALQSFPGVERRSSLRLNMNGTRLLEDYAHHPTELKAFMDALDESSADSYKAVVFQVHRYERLKKYKVEFARELSRADEVFLLSPFGAWTQRTDVPDIDELAQLCQVKTSVVPGEDWPVISERIAQSLKSRDHLTAVIMGAGSSGKLVPHLKMALIGNELERLLPDLVMRRHMAWEKLTTLGVGSHVPLHCDVMNSIELKALLDFTFKHDLRFVPLGCGSNFVGVDTVFEGVTANLKGEFTDIEILSNGQVISGAGVKLVRLVKKLAEENLGGAEALVAIPGSVGGSVRMNAGAQGVEICDVLTAIETYDYEGRYRIFSKDEIDWHYRGSNLPKNLIITKVHFQFQTVNKESAQASIESTRKFRKETQPGGRNPGCAFRNPIGDSAGRLIDKYGLKGLRRGACEVSDIHANFFVNDGGGSEKDFKNLLLEVQKRIFDACGIILQNEVKFCSQLTGSYVKPYRIAVLKGGPSSEREISLESATAVAEALRSSGHDVIEVNITDFELPALSEDIDVVFPVLHGEFGEDGQVQELLEERGLLYVGCGIEASRLAISKYDCNRFLEKRGLPVPFSLKVRRGSQIDYPEGLSLPFIVKPDSQGSTVGLTLVKEESDFEEALAKAFEVDEYAVLEEFIQCQEATVAVLWGKARTVVEIIPPGDIFDFDAKYVYEKGKTIYNCPPQKLPDSVQERMQKLAEKVFAVIGCRDVSRIDMLYRKADDKIFILEVNTMPGFTASSLLPRAARNCGISFAELCSLLVKSAFDR